MAAMRAAFESESGELHRIVMEEKQRGAQFRRDEVICRSAE